MSHGPGARWQAGGGAGRPASFASVRVVAGADDRSDDVSVTETGPGAYRVEIRCGRTTTSHQVTVPDGYPATVGLEGVPGDELVRASFAFLLEREPATSILRRFRLDVIADYFPEYPGAIGRYLP